MSLLRFTMRFRPLALVLLILVIVLSQLPYSAATPVQAAVAAPGNGNFNYAEALQKTILFYEAQRSGKIVGNAIPTRFKWRGDAQLTDGAAQGIDLSGGWVDAGDNMKYGITNASAAAVLAWGAVEYRSAYSASGQLPWLMNQLRWINDYFIKSHPSPNVFWHQVGITNSDHGLWIPIESTHLLTDRTAHKIDPTCPGSDMAAGTAAAMAASSMVFRPTDPAYADTLLTHAEQLYSFADTYRGIYPTCTNDPGQPYVSWSGYQDELVWGAIWLHRAKEAKAAGSGASYLAKAEAEYPKLGLERDTTFHKYKWTHNFDDNTFASYMLMARLKPNDPSYQADVERWLDWWTIGFGGAKVSYTAGGHARLDQWGSLRYAANTAFIAFQYSDWLTDATKKARYKSFAEQQINYILGQNPRNCSYVVGFGACPPQHPHHRTAHGSWAQQQSIPANHRHILYGALVGSPNTDDSFNDSISDFVANEVALDYNAGLTGALAKMYLLYGGTPIADSAFPLTDTAYTCKDEFGAWIIAYSNGTSGIGPSVYLENRSSWPSRPLSTYKFRYFFTLDASDISDVTFAITGGTATISAPVLWNAASKIYYVTVDLTGTTIPTGMFYGPSGPEVRFSLGSRTNSWNSANDWSFQNWDTTNKGGFGSHSYAPNVSVYEGSTKLCGNEPTGSNGTIVPPTNTSVPPTATRTSVVPTNTSVPPTATRTATRTNTTCACTITRTPTRTATRTPSRTSTSATRTNTPIPPSPTRTSVPPTATGVPPTIPPTVPPTTGPSTLKVQYRAADTNASDNQMKPHFNIVNTGTTSVTMSELKIRYYFTKDAGGNMVFNCDWAVKGCGNLSGAFVAATGTNTDTYLEVSFTAGAGSIAAGQSSGEMQLRLNKSDWTNFNEANDYSFDPTTTAFADWTRVVLLRNGTVVWGTQP